VAWLCGARALRRARTVQIVIQVCVFPLELRHEQAKAILAGKFQEVLPILAPHRATQFFQRERV